MYSMFTKEDPLVEPQQEQVTLKGAHTAVLVTMLTFLWSIKKIVSEKGQLAIMELHNFKN